MASLGDIRPLATEGRAGLDSVMNCGMINEQIRLALTQDLGIEAQLVQGTIKGIHGGEAQHMYLRIPAGELDDVDVPVIVDGALDQFTDENLKAGRVNASLYSAELGSEPLPEVVVTKQGETVYGYYQGATPAHRERA